MLARPPFLNLKKITQLKLAAAHLILALISFFATAANAQTNNLSEAEIKGRELARQLCDAQPSQSFTNTGVFQIRDPQGNRTNIPVSFKTMVANDSWQFVCAAQAGMGTARILHQAGQPNGYFGKAGSALNFAPLPDWEINQAFANSDFSLADLGLEFFHWPEQKVLPKTTNLKRGRAYTLLESTNPHPATNGYSRVVSWIDQETGGILEAEAYDAQGKLLKVFEPKSFKKVNGQWELQEMEIRNVQTDSRTRLEFDLKKD